jgi:hypothetical protein
MDDLKTAHRSLRHSLQTSSVPELRPKLNVLDTPSSRIYLTVADLNEAIRLGQIIDAKKMLDAGVIPNAESVKLAILNGWHRVFLGQLYKRGAHPTTEHLYLAIRYGHQDIVEMLLKKGLKPTEIHLLTAISMNYKPIVQLLLGYIQPTEKTLRSAILVENKRLVKRLIQLGVRPTYVHLELAHLLNNPSLLSLLQEAL